ncbi:MAG: NAD(P)/FAD-dependent oxidoreductase [Marinilabiliales bacterium]|nr:NAD(P)/FAD-dependent oxidoreductase [Marinilabiliales bacterium]
MHLRRLAPFDDGRPPRRRRQPPLWLSRDPGRGLRPAQDPLPGSLPGPRHPRAAQGRPGLHRPPQEELSRRGGGDRRHLRRHEGPRGRSREALQRRRSSRHGQLPEELPSLFKNFNRTWGAMLDDRVKNPKLKAVISGLWGYFGLPPSKLSPFYYAMPLMGYLEGGGYYPVGTSQKISDAFVGLIRKHGGEVKLNAKVERILVRDHAATGVRTADGAEYRARAVVSNANAFDTFGRMMPDEKEFLEDLTARMEKYSVSFSTLLVWLGLKTDLVRKAKLEESEIFTAPGYDVEAEYRAALAGGLPDDPGFGLTVYDNLYPGASPKGKNTLNIIVMQGYDYWKKFETDYFFGNKDAYNKEKMRLAGILIDKVEKKFLPGLRQAIEVVEVATPLTNLRFTGHPRGAIYGFDQTVDNSGQRRFPQKTPIGNLYLAGAWTFPGHGYGACVPSGLSCFAAVMKDWQG